MSSVATQVQQELQQAEAVRQWISPEVWDSMQDRMSMIIQRQTPPATAVDPTPEPLSQAPLVRRLHTTPQPLSPLFELVDNQSL